MSTIDLKKFIYVTDYRFNTIWAETASVHVFLLSELKLSVLRKLQLSSKQAASLVFSFECFCALSNAFSESRARCFTCCVSTIVYKNASWCCATNLMALVFSDLLNTYTRSRGFGFANEFESCFRGGEEYTFPGRFKFSTFGPVACDASCSSYWAQVETRELEIFLNIPLRLVGILSRDDV